MMSEPNRLVLLACGRKKAQEPAQAINLYLGTAYQSIHKARRAGVQPFRVVILSARYGLIAEERLIGPYDQKLTATRARQLAPRLQQQWQAIVRPLLVGLTTSCICMGETYRDALAELGVYAELPNLTITEGGLGVQLGQLRTWLYTNH